MSVPVESWDLSLKKEIERLQKITTTNGGNRQTAKIDLKIAKELNKLYLESLQLKWKHTHLTQLLMEREELYKLKN